MCCGIRRSRLFEWKWSDGFRKMREYSWLGEKLLASQEGPRSIKQAINLGSMYGLTTVSVVM